jgi:arylformamidase
MLATLHFPHGDLRIDLSKPIAVSLPVSSALSAARAWYIGPPEYSPVKLGNWVGSVREGAGVNFFNIFLNPHAHGTHTESFGHISPERHAVIPQLNRFFFRAQLISVMPEKQGEDLIIRKSQIESQLKDTEALLVRTFPNELEKKNRLWSSSNPPYFEPAALQLLAERGIQHLLVDLPSVDREEDGGALAAHHAFWNYPNNPRYGATITEFIFVPDEVKDGEYLLNLMVPDIENDAVPSMPVLYAPLP